MEKKIFTQNTRLNRRQSLFLDDLSDKTNMSRSDIIRFFLDAASVVGTTGMSEMIINVSLFDFSQLANINQITKITPTRSYREASK
jgi:hypothetical protein